MNTELLPTIFGSSADQPPTCQARAANLERFSALSALLLSLAMLTPASSSAQASFNAAAEFSPVSNPNGVWSYGWTATNGSTFILDTMHENKFGLDFWEGTITDSAPPGSFPIVFHNGTSSSIVVNGTVLVSPGQLAFHPGPGGEYGVVRFTALTTGEYSFRSTFVGLDFVGPTSTDVHVLVNGVSIFNDVVSTFGGGPSFESSQSLQSGDTIDFTVGRGNEWFLYDSTGVDIEMGPFQAPVPEPATSALMLVGLGTLLVVTRSHKRREN